MKAPKVAKAAKGAKGAKSEKPRAEKSPTEKTSSSTASVAERKRRTDRLVGKTDVTIRIPQLWLYTADRIATLRSSSVRVLLRSNVLRDAIERGLADIARESELRWPPDRQTILRLRKRRKKKLDYASIAARRIIALLYKEKSVSRTEITRLLKSRDRTAMDDALDFLIQHRYVSLHQENTPGRSRAIYTWRGGADGNITPEEIDLIIQELAMIRTVGVKRSAEFRKRAFEEDCKRRNKEWEDAQDRIAAKAAVQEGFTTPPAAPLSPEARATIDELHADYESRVRNGAV